MNTQDFHTNQLSFDALVLDAETRQSLVTIRSLGKRGLRVAALANFGKNAPAFSSRWCHTSLTSPYLEGTKEYINFLLTFLQNNKVTVIIPSSDGTIAILRKYRKELHQFTNIALASEQALTIAINKKRTLEIAKKLGINIPESLTVSHENQLLNAISKLKFPLVIKPNESWIENNLGAKRVCPILVSTTKEAFEAFTKITYHGGEVILQEYLTGTREAINVIYSHKKYYARFAQFAKRMQPPMGGTSVLRKSIALPADILQQSEKLISAIKLEGYAEIEFRRNAKGIPYLMEINPRLSASIEIAVHSGMDLPFLLFQWASKKNIDHVVHYTIGTWERYLAGDIITTIEALRENKTTFITQMRILLDFFLTFLQPMYYDYLDWSDIKPAWYATRYFITRNIKKLFKNLKAKSIIISNDKYIAISNIANAK